jgi:hypothetical protein
VKTPDIFGAFAPEIPGKREERIELLRQTMLSASEIRTALNFDLTKEVHCDPAT